MIPDKLVSITGETFAFDERFRVTVRVKIRVRNVRVLLVDMAGRAVVRDSGEGWHECVTFESALKPCIIILICPTSNAESSTAVPDLMIMCNAYVSARRSEQVSTVSHI